MSGETVIMTAWCLTRIDWEKWDGEQPMCRSPLACFQCAAEPEQSVNITPGLGHCAAGRTKLQWYDAGSVGKGLNWLGKDLSLSHCDFRFFFYFKLLVDNASVDRKPHPETIQCCSPLCKAAFCFHHSQINTKSYRHKSLTSHHWTSWMQNDTSPPLFLKYSVSFHMRGIRRSARTWDSGWPQKRRFACASLAWCASICVSHWWYSSESLASVKQLGTRHTAAPLPTIAGLHSDCVLQLKQHLEKACFLVQIIFFFFFVVRLQYKWSPYCNHSQIPLSCYKHSHPLQPWSVPALGTERKEPLPTLYCEIKNFVAFK